METGKDSQGQEPTRRLPTKEEALQAHANYYLDVLMEETDVAKKRLDYGQIALAIRRLKSEVVGSVKYDARVVEMKFLELTQLTIPVALQKLVDGTAVVEDIFVLEEAIKMIEAKEYEYPVNVNTLKQMITKLREKLR